MGSIKNPVHGGLIRPRKNIFAALVVVIGKLNELLESVLVAIACQFTRSGED